MAIFFHQAPKILPFANDAVPSQQQRRIEL
jgi:hypothetical protein